MNPITPVQADFAAMGVRMIVWEASVFHSNTEAMLVAVPMIGVLVAGFFRLDEFVSRPRVSKPERRSFSHRDGEGMAVCVEPDGRLVREGRAVRRNGKGL